MFQRTIARAGGIASGNEYDPKALLQILLVSADNFSQAAPNTIANNRGPDAT
jgi:hypothetical protein